MGVLFSDMQYEAIWGVSLNEWVDLVGTQSTRSDICNQNDPGGTWTGNFMHAPIISDALAAAHLLPRRVLDRRSYGFEMVCMRFLVEQPTCPSW